MPVQPPPTADLVVPTIGRPSLDVLLAALARDVAAPVASLTLVDDRPEPDSEDLERRVAAAGFGRPTTVLTTGGRGPAAARNAGWRSGSAPWVVFLDDDVVPQPGWGDGLAADLAAADAPAAVGAGVGVVPGRVHVPLPADRSPTDWERQVGGLATAPGWLTADLAVRREALEEVGGLDERFPAAYREDTDLELRLRDAGWTGARGLRLVHHPVGPAGRWASLRRQRGNADDALLARLHGRDWRDRTGEPRGGFRGHLVTVAAGATAVTALAARRRRLAAAAAGLWAGRTATFAWRRIAPGPRSRDEVTTMVLTSVAIPPAAVAHRARGWWRWRTAR